MNITQELVKQSAERTEQELKRSAERAKLELERIKRSVENAQQSGDIESANFYRQQLERQEASAELHSPQTDLEQLNRTAEARESAGDTESANFYKYQLENAKQRTGTGEISFGSSLEDQGKKLEAAKRKTENRQKSYLKDIDNGRDATFSGNEYKYAKRDEARQQREFDRLKKAEKKK